MPIVHRIMGFPFIRCYKPRSMKILKPYYPLKELFKMKDECVEIISSPRGKAVTNAIYADEIDTQVVT
ncbi:hypothetical protein D3C71_920370 [compost metagenome]